MTDTHVSRGAAVASGIAESLRRAGCTILFGVPGGGPNLDLIDTCRERGMRFVLTHGETAAAMMAATYGELTGRPGVCLATRGPGAASMVNGVAHGWLDRAPALAITDCVTADARERVTHQRIDQGGLFAACAKASLTVGFDAAAETRAAIELALRPPWGPVHLDVDPSAPAPGHDHETPPPAPGAGALEGARALLAAARRPVIVAGVGARGAESVLREVAERAGVPVLTTYKAKGAVPESSPVAAGLCTGATIEAPVLEGADAVLAVGLDPVELIPGPWPYPAPVVALAPWPAPSGYFPVAHEVVGPVAATLPRLAPALDGSGWARTGQAFRRAALERLRDAGGGLTPQAVVREARRAFAPGTVATIDAGAHMFPATVLWEVDEPRSALISSGLATMGFALPAAIAAALVGEGRRVVCFTGDGGLGMCLGELETLRRLDLPVTVVVFDDAALSLIEAKQRPSSPSGADAVRYQPVDFAAVARGMGLDARQVASRAELRAALGEAAAGDGPRLVDAMIDASGYPGIVDAVRGGR